MCHAKSTIQLTEGNLKITPSYIIDNYDQLPAVTLFIHAVRFQWHNDDPDYDGYAVLHKLQLPYLREQGYVNLRCVWTLGCPEEIQPLVDSDPSGNRIAAWTYKRAFEELFPGDTVPDAVGVSCCAQFGVTRETIRRRPREDYFRFREWLLSTELNDDASGRVMEYSWHSELCFSALRGW